MAKRPVLLAITSDQHTNSTIGLCPSEGVRLDEGGEYKPSKAQLWQWDRWLEFWATVRRLRDTHKAKLVCVYNGDAVDGDHHNTSQIVTRNQESQAYIAVRVFSIPRDLKPDASYMVRGTVSHVGEGAASEEALAKHLKCERTDAEAWSAWHWRLDVHGRLFDFQHHTSVGGLPWTAPGAIARLAFRHRIEHLERGLPPADFLFRSHLHRHHDSYEAHKTRAIVTPAWQLKTAYAHKVAPDSIADIGGVTCLVEPDGTVTVRKHLYQPDQPVARAVA